ncbi:DUF6883 domain-containing protein [Paractinoplanes rhizophilus]|uniref:DUF6883 domain-containing protein n=1 Tax=Paractinoplanes rhizophilus TaxID=1416877 RepID=A0ABW2I3J8_9ACTN
MTRTANPLVAPAAADSPRPWAGVWIAEDIEQIATGVSNGDWVSGGLGMAGAGLDGLALVSDPVGALLQYGVAWLIEHVKPLSEALDWLAGDPAQIAAHAQTWRNVAAALTADADALARAVRWDTTEWTGSAGDAYRGWVSERERSLRALSQAADTMAAMTDGAGMLIGTVRLMVRDAVATVVSRLITYAVELIASLGGAGPWVVEQATTLCASWAAKIAGWLRDLIASIRNLVARGDLLGRAVEALKKWFVERRAAGGGEGGRPPEDGGGSPGGARSGVPEPPSFQEPEIDPGKITGYAMNPEHPVGRNKYRVINSTTGLGPEDAASVEQQIRDGVRAGVPIAGRADEYGQRWNVDVPLTGPSGSMVVRTAWIVDAGETTPRLVTISFPKG